MTETTEMVYRPNAARYLTPFRATVGLMALPSSEKMSVSSRALFTGRKSPGAFLADAHRLLNNFVKEVGGVTELNIPKIGSLTGRGAGSSV